MKKILGIVILMSLFSSSNYSQDYVELIEAIRSCVDQEIKECETLENLKARYRGLNPDGSYK
ncbi:hypothetical protein MJH12_06565 [bacterium]|nr:hypothetical protein [bacterium]